MLFDPYKTQPQEKIQRSTIRPLRTDIDTLISTYGHGIISLLCHHVISTVVDDIRTHSLSGPAAWDYLERRLGRSTIRIAVDANVTDVGRGTPSTLGKTPDGLDDAERAVLAAREDKRKASKGRVQAANGRGSQRRSKTPGT